ncbi:MAG: M56 family metallopeptidase, partial [bacterium]|nr:M56 family metallopeptidase [bacterium]
METTVDLVGNLSHTAIQTGLNWIWIGLAVTTLAWLIMPIMRRSASGSSRYLAWWVTLSLVILVPLQLTYLSNRSNPEPLALHSSSYQENLSRAEITLPEGNSPPSLIVDNLELPNSIAAGVSPQGNLAQDSVFWTTAIWSVLPLFMIVTWFAVSLLLLTRILVGWLGVSRLKNSFVPLDARYQIRLKQLGDRIGLKRTVRLGNSDRIGSPVAAGFIRPVILLPHGMPDQLSNEQLDMVLLHELAHISRHDDWARLVQAAISAFGFFHPAVHWISHQLDLEREIACDEKVVTIVGSRQNYARCLTRLLELSTDRCQPRLAHGAIMTKKQIHRRFEMLFSKNKKEGARGGLRTSLTLSVVVAAAVAMIQVAPVIALPGNAASYAEMANSIDYLLDSISPEHKQEAATDGTDKQLPSEKKSADSEVSPEAAGLAAGPLLAAAGDDDDHRRGFLGRSVDAVVDLVESNHRGLSYRIDDDGETSVLWQTGKRTLRLRMYGEVRFTRDDQGIESVSRDGYFEISEKIRSGKRELEIESGKNGKLDYNYWKDGRKEEYDADAQAWFADILLDVIRLTGIGAEERVARILKSDGVDGVIDEMMMLRSDHVLRTYFTHLIEQGELSPDDHSRVLNLATEQMDSDYEKAELALAIAEFGIQENGLTAGYIELIKTLDSDYETRRVLSELSLDETVSQDVIIDILGIALKMDSDFETAELLVLMADYS